MDADARGRRPGNLAARIAWGPRLGRGFLAVAAGIAASVTFAPVEWAWLAWLSLLPLLVVGLRPNRSPVALGYLWGLGYFTCCFGWLREIFPPVPFGVALVCAAYPAVWLKGVAILREHLRWPASRDLEPRAGQETRPAPMLTAAGELVFVAAAAALWVALEWMRSWLFGGFPWDLLGNSQWQHLRLAQTARFAGVYGLSFAVAAVNVSAFVACCNLLQRKELRLRRRVPWPLLACAVLVALAWALHPATLPTPDARLRVAAVQGNIPQIRFYSEAQLALAEEVYVSQTQRLVNWEKPDLVVWPETAIPKSLTCHDDTVALMAALFAATRTPMIVGTLDYRRSVADPEHPLAFNAAVQYDAAGQPVNRYNKIKIVPFGEVTPFESLWPEWLLRWLTMGRSLTPGDAHTVFQFRGARIGVNICYEDIFPEISRAAVQRGANVLLTITNDAWYNETAGSRQHLSHAVFRAIETGRPMLRNGNNSDTCLIWPDGRVEGLLRDPASGSPFYRGSRVYDVPIWETPPLTFHTRHGNWFAHLAVLAAAVTWLWCLYRYLDRRRRLYDKVQPVV